MPSPQALARGKRAPVQEQHAPAAPAEQPREERPRGPAPATIIRGSCGHAFGWVIRGVCRVRGRHCRIEAEETEKPTRVDPDDSPRGGKRPHATAQAVPPVLPVPTTPRWPDLRTPPAREPYRACDCTRRPRPPGSAKEAATLGLRCQRRIPAVGHGPEARALAPYPAPPTPRRSRTARASPHRVPAVPGPSSAAPAPSLPTVRSCTRCPPRAIFP